MLNSCFIHSSAFALEKVAVILAEGGRGRNISSNVSAGMGTDQAFLPLNHELFWLLFTLVLAVLQVPVYCCFVGARRYGLSSV